jgi:1-acyl-sn-glycerol-3-phosphate acyltransferase
VIFPEGTRTIPGEQTRYKGGIGAVYEVLSPTIYPVALNSGCFWGRNQFLRLAGTVEVEILPALPTGIPKADFMALLQETIETATAPLVQAPKYTGLSEYY